MARIKKVFLLGIMLLLTVLLCLSFNGKISRAETTQDDYSIQSSEEVTPRGLYTNLVLSIDGGNGQVWATAKNKFTLFPSVVTVRVELYISDTY